MRVLADKAEYDACLADCATRGRLLVVDFTATWCGPCQRIAPVFEALAKEFPQVTFVKVDVDENQETAQACQVSAMPTFKGYQAKSEVFSIRGADEATLRAEISKNAGSKFEGVGQRLGGGDVAGAAPAGNMSEREKRLAALERRGLCGGGGSGGSTAPAAPASVASEVPASPAAVSLAAVAPAAVAPPAADVPRAMRLALHLALRLALHLALRPAALPLHLALRPALRPAMLSSKLSAFQPAAGVKATTRRLARLALPERLGGGRRERSSRDRPEEGCLGGERRGQRKAQADGDAMHTIA